MSQSKTLFTLIISFFTVICFSQDMQEGFTYLEKGEFAKAEVFFKEVLKTYPDNKTANLCYGRAMGLNGNPDEATQLFDKMLKQYPGDFELELNYAESLLWNKRYADGKEYYGRLAADHPDSFPALLGYANTLSNLKEYPEALDYVNRALAVSPGNDNALVSRKYVRLGYAAKLVQKRDYDGALGMLNDNLIDFPGDKDTLMNKANIYLMTKQGANAEQTYRELATTPEDSITALNGIALALHTCKKDKKALSWAVLALKKADNLHNEKLINLSRERYIQALIWNKRYSEAEKEIVIETEKYPNENRVLALSATLGMYKSNFNQSISDYQNILVNDSLSFDGNLGIANAYFAKGDPYNAYNAVNKTLTIFENQKDATGFLVKLSQAYAPYVEEKIGHSLDNGNNRANLTATTLHFPVSFKWAFSAFYQYRKTENTFTNRSAETNDFKIAAQYQFAPKVSANVSVGTSSASSYANNYSQALVDVFIKAKPFKLQDLEAGYKRDVQNFNADLVNSEITADNLYLNYNMGTNIKLGWFTQYFYTSQSDGNKRNLLFTSLYYSFMSDPVLKFGINYQYISFKYQVPETYFSPARFNVVEVFTDFIKDEQVAEAENIYFGLTAAAGYQWIENNSKQGTYRLQGKIGYKFSDRLIANLYGLHSNIASATAAGFTYTEFGIRFKWYLTSKPLFFKTGS
ncbi:tetratricopeptide repeat protein [Flavobacterium psychrotrophum]|uniref:tetratricopeptide repeat protein n=1 Tax=Flavobacterium psychrotrophum TaxID=2294119 RepID=UPI001F090122|nr:tetratricopeptide repeat protein [Flavobacterium psychrotrophum]